MFPFELENEELTDIDNVEELEEQPPVEYGIDFETGQLTGGKVTGSKAVAVWAYNAIMTARYRYDVTSWQYGCELSDLIGRVLQEETLQAMAESIVQDCLAPNKDIEGIEDFECKKIGDRLIVSFTIDTPYGEEDVNVTVRG